MEAFRPGRTALGAAALLALVGLLEILVVGYDRPLAGIATYLLAAAALMGAQRFPLAVSPFVAGVYALTPLAGFDVSQPAAWLLLLAFAFFATGVHTAPSRRPAGLASVAVALAIVYAGLEWLTEFDPSLLFGVALALGAWGLGVALRQAVERERRAGAEAERARLELAFARERAVTAERERVAAEVHDIVAHALGAMVLQAAAARDALRRDGLESGRMLARVADAGREALAETATLVRALRHGGGADGGVPDAGSGGPMEERGRIRSKDTLLPALFGVVAGAEILSDDYGPLAVGLGAFWAACAVLVARRAFPLGLPLAVTAILLVAGLLGFEWYEATTAIPISGLAYFAAGRHVARARIAWGLAAVLASAALLLADEARRGALSPDVVLVLALALAPWAIGVALRATLARARMHAGEAERARLEAEVEVERATAAERRRIARELHDLLASSLSVMVVQASLAAELAGMDTARAEAAVAEVERAGRSALDRTGGLLRLIHQGGAGTHPQHGTADLPGLVAEYERAGLVVELDGADLERVPAGLDASVYRIVQEALTNALKHAPGSRVRIRLAQSPSRVEVEVVNTAPGGERRARVPGGHGLTGLRERVGLYGGRLDARPTADGGFLLAASMPVSGER